ncbi:MAG: hypothetical protein HWN66_20830 [Candidatus Helarchaeota archaeon]|nr:hypothetical protein [Candidatus Helarchaeota archaeon]
MKLTLVVEVKIYIRKSRVEILDPIKRVRCGKMDTGEKLSLVGFISSIGSVGVLLIGNVYAFAVLGTEVPDYWPAVFFLLRPFIIIGLILGGTGIGFSIIGRTKSRSKLGFIGLVIGIVITALYVVAIFAYFTLTISNGGPF